MSEQPKIQEVLDAARLLFPANDVIELRVPKARRFRVISGYYRDLQKLAEAAYQLENTRPTYEGIYWTLNQVNPDLIARADHKLEPYAGATTSDDDILRRRLLPIDFDPKRPAGISSTEAQHEAALELARTVWAALIESGWPEPIFADSGNGAHLLYQIDLPNDAESLDLVKRCLEALAGRFNVAEPIRVDVDLTTFNASRIFKIYGTTARKGDNTAERPHRVSRILHVPALLQPVPVSLLQTLAALAPQKQKSQAQRANTPRSSRPVRSEFDLRQFLDKHGIPYRDPVPYDGGYKFTLLSCPFDPSHQGKDAAVFERSDGYGFKCFHSSCAGRDWKEFRELFEPDAYSGRSAGGNTSTRYPAYPPPSDHDVPPPRSDEGEDELPLTREDLNAAIDDAIARKDLDAVNALVPELSRLSDRELWRIEDRLAEAFGRKFKVKRFQAAIREERRRALAGFRARDTSLPWIVTNNRPMRDVVADSLQALRAANDPPFLFVRSGEMVFVEIDEQQRPSIKAVEKAHLRGRMDRAANYVRRGAETDIAVPPPLEVVEDTLALPSAEWCLPALEFVVEVPTLRSDGTVLSKPGYDSVSRMLYRPAPDFKMEPIPDYVDSRMLQESVAFIDEAIGDFPYAEEKDEKGVVFLANPSRANVFGLLLTPIVRPAISGAVPMALIDAPQAGTGKSLLVDLFSIITTGRAAAMMPFPRSEEEIQKCIGATLLEGSSLVCFDNVEGILNSPTLALVITAKEYKSRILGVTQNLIAPNRATWLATGNNIKPSGDMPRRCYHIRLDAKKSKPYQGREFKHENLLDWARSVRPQLLRSLLIIARAWYQRKVKLPVTDPWGSFEQWHATVSGILRSADIEGFLANLQKFLTEADDMAVQWESFLREIEFAYGPNWFTVGLITGEVRQGTPLSPSRFTLPDSLADVDRRKEGGLERALGKSFRKRIDTRYGDDELHIEGRIRRHDKQYEWRVLTKETEKTAAATEPSSQQNKDTVF